MTLPTSLSFYTDVQAHFEAALAAGGGRVIFPNKAQATRWRTRAYYYRTLLRKESEAHAYSEDPATRALAGTTPYDRFYLQLREAGPAWEIVINLENPEIGVFLPLEK